jgi:hypothetical protein
MEGANNMPEDLKRFSAVLVERLGPECRILTIDSHTEHEIDALEIAKDIALLEGCELVYLSKCKAEPAN